MNSIYFARVGDYVKIGFSCNPQRRVKTLHGKGRLRRPEDLDQRIQPELILVIPFCRIRDERNMHLLFARHWVVGEWFRWSPAFDHQMRTMRFVTHAVRLKDLTAARHDLGIGGAPAKEARWGQQTPDRLAAAQLGGVA